MVCALWLLQIKNGVAWWVRFISLVLALQQCSVLVYLDSIRIAYKARMQPAVLFCLWNRFDVISVETCVCMGIVCAETAEHRRHQGYDMSCVFVCVLIPFIQIKLVNLHGYFNVGVFCRLTFRRKCKWKKYSKKI